MVVFLVMLFCNWPSLAITTHSSDTDSKPLTDLTARLGYAVWYRVPPNSLAHRRAQGCEFTAAHNHLPLGTLVRVTRLSNGKTVLVRITDRGITNRRANIDICREAAEELGMIREGFSRVRLEIISELPAATGSDQDQVSAH